MNSKILKIFSVDIYLQKIFKPTVSWSSCRVCRSWRGTWRAPRTARGAWWGRGPGWCWAAPAAGWRARHRRTPPWWPRGPRAGAPRPSQLRQRDNQISTENSEVYPSSIIVQCPSNNRDLNCGNIGFYQLAVSRCWVLLVSCQPPESRSWHQG